VYADETSIHSSYTTSHAWDDGSGAGLKAPICKGRRLIIDHAGNTPHSTVILEKLTGLQLVKKFPAFY
jgi:hypothetical protein